MRRETQNILLLLVGGALLKIALNGSYLRYVKPSAQPWVMLAGAVMVALGVLAIVADIRAARAGRVPDQHEHGHDHQSDARSPWLLLLPVLAIFLIAPPALGADAVTRDSNRTISAPAVVQQGAAAFPPLPAGAVAPVSVSEFITRSVWDSTNSLNGRTVRLAGFVVHEDGAVYLARLVITCCAADATPMKVKLDDQDTISLRDDQWVEADGRLRPGSATQANGYTPTLTATAIHLVIEPADPYEY